jgi:hypothetical protein
MPILRVRSTEREYLYFAAISDTRLRQRSTARRMERILGDQGGPPPDTTHNRFAPGVEDVIILPMVAIALAVQRILKAALLLLIHILDFAFPILLQVMRFPLFTVRIVGDGIAGLLKVMVAILPVGSTRRQAWRAFVSRHWVWLRQRLSYRAFEEAVHHAFENGMAWVFRKCRTLTPRGALLVIACAVLWLPISFGTATVMHAMLIAKAASLPPWMQLLHPVATVIAKSKLLVLPVYPAAWPQAKAHPFVQAIIRSWRYLTTLHLIRKTGRRFRQTEAVAAEAIDGLERAASFVGLSQMCNFLIAALNASAAWCAQAVRAALVRTVEFLSMIPLLGTVVQHYEARYHEVSRQREERFSEKVSDFFARWSIKFSAEYYEARDREHAAKGNAGA